LDAIIAKLVEIGADVEEGEDWVRVSANKRPKGARVKTLPYPGFPTDLQQPMTVLLSVAEGTSVIIETIFESRFKYIDEIRRMGAKVTIDDRLAVVEGVNKLTGANVLSEDKLFATLDPTTRKMELTSGENVLITDTVGFIRKLPHHLIKAFKSTLDEVRYADILMIVADMSDSEMQEQLTVTEEIVEELGASDKPRVYVYNKCDRCEAEPKILDDKNSVVISAKLGLGVELLTQVIERIIKQSKRDCKLLLPYSKQSLLSDIYDEYSVKSVEYLDGGISVEATLDERGVGLYRNYLE